MIPRLTWTRRVRGSGYRFLTPKAEPADRATIRGTPHVPDSARASWRSITDCSSSYEALLYLTQANVGTFNNHLLHNSAEAITLIEIDDHVLFENQLRKTLL
jgi:hypothetical protein